MIKMVVYGQPVGKGRPKFAKRGQFIHTYTPDKTKEYENSVKATYLSTVGKDKGYMAGIPISVRIGLYYSIPKSTSKRRREMMINGEIRPCVKPDVDNCIKAILDALNGIAYADDNQIVEVYAFKLYSDQPRAEISISNC